MENQPKKRRKLMKDVKVAQIARLEIVANFYKRGYSFREIRAEVMNRLNLATYSLDTLHKDVHRLLDEWQKYRVSKTEQVIQLELQRNDEIIKEAWLAWDKSKTDYEKRVAKQQGLPAKKGTQDGQGGNDERIETTKIEQQRELIRKYGDPRYLEVILKAEERNAKLLGYDKPIKVDVYSAPPKEEAPTGAQYDINALPVDMIVEMAYKLQDVEFEKRQKKSNNGTETSDNPDGNQG